MRPASVKGRAFAYKDDPAVLVRDEVVVPVCDLCGDIWMDEAQTKALDKALSKSYKRARLRRQRALIKDLCKRGLTQQQIERVADLSPGYVSKLRTNKVASGTTYRLLYVLHERPEETLRLIGHLDARFSDLAAQLKGSKRSKASHRPRNGKGSVAGVG